MSNNKAIELINISKAFKRNTVIDNISLSVEKGEMVSIIGTSGKGKTTLLNMIGLISKPSSGTIKINGKSIRNINSKSSMLIRRNAIGYLFQNYGLVDDESVLWNLKLALTYKKIKSGEKIKSIDNLLRKFDMLSLKSKSVLFSN